MKTRTIAATAAAILLLGALASATILVVGAAREAELAKAASAADEARAEEAELVQLLGHGLEMNLTKDQVLMLGDTAIEMATATDKTYPGLVRELMNLLRDQPQEKRLTYLSRVEEAGPVLAAARKKRIAAEFEEHRRFKAARLGL